MKKYRHTEADQKHHGIKSRRDQQNWPGASQNFLFTPSMILIKIMPATLWNTYLENRFNIRCCSLRSQQLGVLCDMLPPLKSLILKWELLAQWLYWAKYLQAILACPAIFLPGHGHISYLLSCPDTDSLCCQHPSCLFTDVDCCISISVHLISARTAVNSFG